ncbi:hypothetical protein Afil01_66170 [Actinorhabdospora filicis]|uniref:Excreted virulence factor EspC, type VII ESX diderm n=1 Tax=Actinorhabdospora filicis TaxID=1785913 RepID=A0A9W6STS8_9ACTN|nr:hypothetical protein [Actinorhabdospora filicis]GLZ81810.1 hypothetical protein Afil01_66170 [Actinorhabdospora filicis]
MSFHVDFAGMTAAEGRLKRLSDNSSDIATVAKDADPEWFIWGLFGSPLAAGYFPLAEQIHTHLKDLTEALNANATRINECAAQYKQREEDTTATMDIIQRRLDGKKPS